MVADKHITALRQIQEIVNLALTDVPAVPRRNKRDEKPAKSSRGSAPLSFDMGVLAFMNAHARKLSGPQKFTLLVAWMAKGSNAAQVPYLHIKAQWNKMTSVLGDFNLVHGNRPKRKGWVNSDDEARWKLMDG